MFKNIIVASLIVLSLTYTSLDGFDVTKQKFKVFHRLSQTGWGKLFCDGFEIDVKAAELAAEKLSGGYFDEKIHTVIPSDFYQTEKVWKRTKDRIAQLIGPIPAPKGTDSALWENSSKTVNGLLQDAQKMAPLFKKDFQNIALAHRAMANFGPGNEFIVKSSGSLIRKVNRDAKEFNLSEAEAVSQIGDVLRGTVIADKVQKIPGIIAAIVDYADKQGAKVVFKNLWLEDRESGYVGIHAKLLLPILEAEGTRYVLAEMQIHLDSIADGTAMSAKERAHLIYENVRSEQTSPVELSAASKLLFLTAMDEALQKIEQN